MTLPKQRNHSASPHAPSSAARTFAAAALLCLCTALVGCKQADPTPQVVVAVQAEKPEVGPISERIEGDAVLAPLLQAALSPKISAPIKKFYVQRGSQVHAGQLLVSLEDSDLAATALDSSGSYKAAQATYQQATGIRLPAEMQTAELDVKQAQANLDLSRGIVTGRAQLFQQGAIPGRDLDTAKAALVQAQAAYDTATQHLKSLQQIGSSSTAQAARGELTSAQGKYLNAEAMESYASLRSPINGVVTDRPLFAGEMAPAGTPLITVMDTSSLLAKLHLAQSTVQQMKVGDQAEVTVPGIEEPVSGAVSLISPALDPGSTTIEVWVQLKNPDGKLKPGTPVHVAIQGRTVPDALQVPASALLTGEDGNLGVMTVASDGTAHLKPVTVGIRLPNKVQLLGGVGPQTMVITSGGYGLQDGTKVKMGATGEDSGAGEGAGG